MRRQTLKNDFPSFLLFILHSFNFNEQSGGGGGGNNTFSLKHVKLFIEEERHGKSAFKVEDDYIDET